MKILNKEIVDGEIRYSVTGFIACSIQKRWDGCGYCIRLATETPSRFYTIISSDKLENGVYKWLPLEEANDIVQKLYKNDCLDLTEKGNYHIFEEGYIQTVFIQNNIDEYTDEEIPIIISLPEE